jgi:GntR family transcriptional repressor for pyruvate dehydrogenase complex
VSDFLQTSIGLLTGTHQVSLSELVEARRLLEGPAARFASQRASDEQISRLAAESAEDLAGASRRIERSRDFHFELLRIAGNRLIEVMAAPVFSVLAQRYLRDDIPPRTWTRLAEEHDLIARSITARDADAAEEMMMSHVDSVGALYVEVDG